MGWFDDIVDFAEENIVDPITDAAEEAVDYVEDNIVDPLTEIVEDVVEWVDDNIVDPAAEVAEDVVDWVEDTAEKASDAVGDIFESIAEAVDNVWDDITDAVDQAWDAITETAANTWDWLEETVEDAVDWLTNAAEKVYDFIVEEAIPYIVSLTKIIPAAVRLLGAIVVLPLCYLYKEIFGEEEATVIQGIANGEPRLIEEFNIARLPSNQKYAVFSDIHMFVDGDLDFFNNSGNSKIYRSALGWYSTQGYHLIENGDVEDFWMRGGSSKGLILTLSDPLPWPYYSDAFESIAFRSANQAHAFGLFISNDATYATIRALFHDRGKYTKMIGNHDDVWSDPAMDPIIQALYPGISVNDYCVLYNNYSGEAESILAHGHQSDIFNTPMCNFAGKAATDFASHLHEVTFGEINMFSRTQGDWGKEWNDKGFINELSEIDMLEFKSFSEYDLYEDLENIYGDSLSQPYLILGHTHQPKNESGIPRWMYYDQWDWKEYSNSGTTGMWEGVVVGLEIENSNVNVIAWKNEADGSIARYSLERSGSGSYNFLNPIKTSVSIH